MIAALVCPLKTTARFDALEGLIAGMRLPLGFLMLRIFTRQNLRTLANCELDIGI